MNRYRGLFVGLICFLLWFLFLHGVSINGFSQGYLRTKAHLDGQNKCEDVKQLYNLPNKSYLDGLGRNESCWSKPKFEHVVILLIDSLRFDFCVMDQNYSINENQAEGHAYIDPGDTAKIVRYYKNRLPIINETVSLRPDHTRLFRFVADPPTATMQRIKALTTGGMPTFLDISDNFASEAIHEDNWVVQMANSGRKAIFMGDDTWLSMYPTSFSRAYPYPSFEVRDLHTVDRGVMRHLVPEIKGYTVPPLDLSKKGVNLDFGGKLDTLSEQDSGVKNNEKWDLILGHMLGVDHVGHRLGSNHPEMASKLTEMNGVITRVMESIDNNTLFIVLSDHGMNYEGNHGGSTVQETSASLLLYSKSPIFKNALNPILAPGVFDSISQIDIVPTISMLLGAPIPFGSLGKIIPELFWNAEHPEEMLDPLHINTAQLFRYLLELEKADSRFPSDEMAILKELFNKAVETHSTWQTSNINSQEDTKAVYTAYKEFHDKAGDMCRRLWTTFDTETMQYSIYAMIGTSVVALVVALANPMSIHRALYYVAVGLFWVPLTWLVGWKSIGLPLSLDWILVVATIGSLSSFVIGIFLEFDIFFPEVTMSTITRLGHNISQDKGSFSAGLLFTVLLVLRCASLTSNSFIIHAQPTNTFILTSLSGLLAYIAYKRGFTAHALAMIGGVFLSRISYHTFAGRHENYFVGSSVQDLAVYTILPSIAIVLCMVAITKYISGNLITQLLFIIPFGLLMVFWTVQAKGLIDQFYAVRILIPWTIFASGIFQFLYTSIIPFIFPHKNASGGYKASFEQDVLIQSLSRVIIGLLPTTLIVLGPASPLPVLCFLATGMAIVSASYAMHTSNKVSCAWIAVSVLLWSYMGYTYFYATSHLPVFTALQMSAAFIGIEGFSLEFGGLLVIYNTMFSHFLLAVASPLLVATLVNFDTGYIHKAMILHSFIYTATLAATFASSFMLRRHLFVWTVFAPYFVFECITVAVVDIGLLLGAVIAFGASNIKMVKYK